MSALFTLSTSEYWGYGSVAVGFNYVNSNSVLEKRWNLLGYDRIIDRHYGEPTELARVLNQWRERSGESFHTRDRDAQD